MVTITIREQGKPPQRMRFATSRIDLGRAEENDVVLPARNVSKAHARILRRGADLVLTDAGSTNGTMVNGRRITAPQILQPSDVISIGTFRLSAACDDSHHDTARPESALSPPSGLVRSAFVSDENPEQGNPTLERLPSLEDSDDEERLPSLQSADTLVPGTMHTAHTQLPWPPLSLFLERAAELGLGILLVLPPPHGEAQSRSSLPGTGRDRMRREQDAVSHLEADASPRLMTWAIEQASKGVAGAVSVPGRSATQGLARFELLLQAAWDRPVPPPANFTTAVLDFVVRVGQAAGGALSIVEAFALSPNGGETPTLLDVTRAPEGELGALNEAQAACIRDLLKQPARASSPPPNRPVES